MSDGTHLGGTRTCKTRKRQQCIECMQTAPVGTLMRSMVWMQKGERPERIYTHPACFDLASELCAQLNGGRSWEIGEFVDTDLDRVPPNLLHEFLRVFGTRNHGWNMVGYSIYQLADSKIWCGSEYVSGYNGAALDGRAHAVADTEQACHRELERKVTLRTVINGTAELGRRAL